MEIAGSGGWKTVVVAGVAGRSSVGTKSSRMIHDFIGLRRQSEGHIGYSFARCSLGSGA
jgi:hypothetical protein